MPSTSDGTPALSVPKRTIHQNGLVAKLLIYGFFTVIGGMGAVLIWTAAVWPMINVMRAMTWQQVPCRIISSQVVGADTYRIDIRYEYVVGPQMYTGSKYSFFNLKTSARGWKENVVRKLPPESRTNCYVNPSLPNESVLDRSVHWDILWALGGVPFLLVGLGGGFLAYVRGLRENRKSKVLERQLDGGSSRTAGSSAPLVTTLVSTEYSDESLRETSGSLDLQPESTPGTAFVGLMMVNLIWNGMTLAFGWTLAKNWVRGVWHFFPDIIALPFVCVGAVLAFAAVRTFMALFNPVPFFRLSRHTIPLGGSADLSWTFNRSPQSIQQLTITLKGIEEAKYTRGTDTLTDTAVFHEEVLFETAEPSQIAAGNAEIRIPTDSMHTLTGNKNKILWKVHVKGSIVYWPDIDSTFIFQVVPHE